MGFTEQDHSHDDSEEIKRMFTPEFRNRLDSIIRFTALDEKTIQHVVDKFIMELESQLADRNVTLELDNKSRAWLAKHGYDPAMGARPMARLIQDKIKKVLADEILFGKLAEGGHAIIKMKKGEFVLDLEK